MANRNNLVFSKLKPRKPDELMNITVTLPAYLLGNVKMYGDISKTVKKALKLFHESKFKDSLIEITGDLRSEIDKLETVRDSDKDLDEDHLQLLELYKDVYFRLKKARILRKK